MELSKQSCLHSFRPAAGYYRYTKEDAEEIYSTTYNRMSTDCNLNPGNYAFGYTGCLRETVTGFGSVACSKGPTAEIRARMDPTKNKDMNSFQKYGECDAADPKPSEGEFVHLSQMTKPNPSKRKEALGRSDAIKTHYFAKPTAEKDEIVEQNVTHGFDARTCYEDDFNRSNKAQEVYSAYTKADSAGSGFSTVKAYAELQVSHSSNNEGTDYQRNYRKHLYHRQWN